MQKTLEKFDDKLRIVFTSGNKEECVKELTENRKKLITKMFLKKL